MGVMGGGVDAHMEKGWVQFLIGVSVSSVDKGEERGGTHMSCVQNNLHIQSSI